MCTNEQELTCTHVNNWSIRLRILSHSIVIYYDSEPSGVNATSLDFPCRNEFFNSWTEFETFLEVEYNERPKLIEITALNYQHLCDEGIFDVS
jgi:hypothetical protein